MGTNVRLQGQQSDLHKITQGAPWRSGHNQVALPRLVLGTCSPPVSSVALGRMIRCAEKEAIRWKAAKEKGKGLPSLQTWIIY